MLKSLTATATAAAAVFVASFLSGGAAQASLWYPDYASTYESGRCTDQPSSSLLKLASYASSGYEDQATCCQESFPGQQHNSYCSCMGGCSSQGDLARNNHDIDVDDTFDVEFVFEKLMNETRAFEMYQAEQEKYWLSLSAALPSLLS
eukprot:scaffold14346_cov67-Skeletonema_dohrnii-CCMP3373.AAC.2